MHESGPLLRFVCVLCQYPPAENTHTWLQQRQILPVATDVSLGKHHRLENKAGLGSNLGICLCAAANTDQKVAALRPFSASDLKEL